MEDLNLTLFIIFTFFNLDCGLPSSLENGNFSITTAVSESMYLSGTMVEYTCDSGYALYPKENKTLSCNSSGEWEGIIGDCYPSKYYNYFYTLYLSCSLVCSPAPDLTNGFKNLTNQIVFNDTLTLELEVLYSCDLAIQMISENKNNWTCQSPGLWSHTTLPKCLKGIFSTCKKHLLTIIV